MSESIRCWNCGGKLAKKPHSTELFYRLAKDQLGNDVRVHVVCEGDTMPPTVTAQPAAITRQENARISPPDIFDAID